MVEKTFEPGMTVELGGSPARVVPNQLFTWRRLVAQGSLNEVPAYLCAKQMLLF
jgi:Transposase